MLGKYVQFIRTCKCQEPTLEGRDRKYLDTRSGMAVTVCKILLMHLSYRIQGSWGLESLRDRLISFLQMD